MAVSPFHSGVILKLNYSIYRLPPYFIAYCGFNSHSMLCVEQASRFLLKWLFSDLLYNQSLLNNLRPVRESAGLFIFKQIK